MELTKEQKQIISLESDLKVNAVAGSGKTTTILEYARKRPESKMLYLAFNRSVRDEATRMFNQAGLGHVRVETAHSLAYKYIVAGTSYQVVNSYKPSELVDILHIPLDYREMLHLKIAHHVWQYALRFCHSGIAQLSELDYVASQTDLQVRQFVLAHQESILHYTRLFLAKMHEGAIAITHDFYLKKFQLLRPRLPYEYILFDEGQDASPVMLDIFLNQPARKLIIGDTYQQIYGWRFAINALEDASFTPLMLSKSFRFGNDIAKLARGILSLKSIFMPAPNLSITGNDQSRNIHSRAYIARTNAALLSKAIELTVLHQDLKQIYFEGQLASYTFSESGGSLFDIYYLFRGQNALINDPLIASMRSFEELVQFSQLTSDQNLKVLMDLVRKYESQLLPAIQRLQQQTLDVARKKEADMIFTTVHKSKGLEYDEVFLCNDFVNEQQILNQIPSLKGGVVHQTALSEEVNMLYTAITRTRTRLHIPTDLLPTGMYAGQSKNITTNLSVQNDSMASRIEVLQGKWSRMDDLELHQLYLSGKPLKTIGLLLGKSLAEIHSRVEKLKLYNRL